MQRLRLVIVPRQYALWWWLRPNEAEVEQALGIKIGNDTRQLEQAGARLLKRLQVEAVLITRGRDGMALFVRGEKPVQQRAPWRTAVSVIVPMLQPSLRFLVVTQVIAGLQIVTQVQVLTRGGPAGSTSTLVYELYRRAFGDGVPDYVIGAPFEGANDAVMIPVWWSDRPLQAE